jgi:hypothetical protein
MSDRQQIPTLVDDHARRERRALRGHRREAEVQHRMLMDRSGAGSPPLLIRDPGNAEGFVARPRSVWVRSLARLCAASLDRQIASGLPPESNRLTAARAERLVSLPLRRSLAQDWRDLSARAAGPATARSPRVWPCRDRIMAADRDILALRRALSASLPVPARGVALARGLLSDGAGPLYNRSCPTDLAAALARVVELLDPTVALVA